MRVLLVRAGALGDVLLLRRTIAVLCAAGHGVSLVAPPARTVLAGEPGLERLLAFEDPETARLLAGEAICGPLARALGECDVAIAYTRSADLTDALRARVRRLLVQDPSPPPGRHASRWLAEPLSALGLDPAATEPPDLCLSEAENAAADPLVATLPAAFVAVHPGSGSAAKNWPVDRLLELARSLAAGRRFLVALGPAEDEAPWRDVERATVARDLPLRLLAAVLSRCGLFVGNDSGVSHLAAATGAPTLALFGPTDPASWAPVGRRTRVLRGEPLSGLGVEAVAAAARRLLATSAVSGPPSG